MLLHIIKNIIRLLFGHDDFEYSRFYVRKCTKAEFIIRKTATALCGVLGYGSSIIVLIYSVFNFDSLKLWLLNNGLGNIVVAYLLIFIIIGLISMMFAVTTYAMHKITKPLLTARLP